MRELDLCQDYEDDELRDGELAAAVPAAVEALRKDKLIGEKVAPLLPPKKTAKVQGVTCRA